MSFLGRLQLIAFPPNYGLHICMPENFFSWQTLWIFPFWVLDFFNPVNILKLCSWVKLCDLERVWASWVFLISLVAWSRLAITLRLIWSQHQGMTLPGVQMPRELWGLPLYQWEQELILASCELLGVFPLILLGMLCLALDTVLTGCTDQTCPDTRGVPLCVSVCLCPLDYSDR